MLLFILKNVAKYLNLLRKPKCLSTPKSINFMTMFFSYSFLYFSYSAVIYLKCSFNKCRENLIGFIFISTLKFKNDDPRINTIEHFGTYIIIGFPNEMILILKIQHLLIALSGRR